MKILAIRGENLASLAAPFEVDFEAPPLSDAGVFAITGPTGAGKSTLLDAVTLALFGETPRSRGLQRSRSVDPVGTRGDDDDALHPGDARHLLRRGAMRGFAEVDFEGVRGRRYRARWSARRATRGAKRLQDVERTLFALGGGEPTPIDVRGVREWEDALRERLGLSASQFSRSVLLPQGDFAAFLRADRNERGAILSAITSDTLYQRLGKAAHEKRARLDAERGALVAAAAGALLLSSDDRARLEAERAALGAELAALRALGAALRDAEARTAQLVALRRDRGLADARRTAAEAAWRAATEALGRAEAPLAAALAARAALEPELEAAAALDRELAVAEHLASSGEAERAARGAAADAADAAVAEARRELLEADARRERAAAALDALAPVARLEAAHPDLGARVDELGHLAARRHELGLKLAAAKSDAEGALAALATADVALASADAAVREATSHLAALGPVDEGAEALLEARATARAARHRTLAALPALAERRRELDGEVALHAAQLDAARARVSDAADIAARAREAMEEPRVRLGTAERVVETLRVALSVTDHRARLVDGDPCPVCGALHHPWTSDAPIRGKLDANEQELAAARAAHRQAERALAEAEAEVGAAGRAVAGAAEAHARAERQRADTEARWSAALAELSAEDRAGVDADLAGWVAASAAGVAADEARRRERAAERAERSRRADALGRAERQRAERAATREGAAARSGSADAGVATRERELSELTELEQAHRGRVRVALVELPELAARVEAPLELRERLRDRLATLAQARDEHGASGAARERAAERLGERSLSATEARGAAERAAAHSVEARGHRDALAARRATLLGGEPTDEVRKRHDQAVEAARAAKDAASGAHAGADRARAAASAHASTLADTEQALGASLSALVLDIEATTALDTTSLPRLVPPGDADAPPAPALELWRTTIDARQTEREAARAQAERALSDDDAARTRHAAAAQALADHDAGRRAFDTLAARIGDSDGSKLRNFAQSLTLRTLVALANRQLARLRPRYELRSHGASGLDLVVVDRHLGDERRTLQSLSGGETFLVSLALALALSDLASGDVVIRSLFIDEGFGTLDPDSLDAALGVLDELRQHGRTVGLVSHVPGLAERVGVRVAVEPVSLGASVVRILAGG